MRSCYTETQSLWIWSRYKCVEGLRLKDLIKSRGEANEVISRYHSLRYRTFKVWRERGRTIVEQAEAHLGIVLEKAG